MFHDSLAPRARILGIEGFQIYVFVSVSACMHVSIDSVCPSSERDHVCVYKGAICIASTMFNDAAAPRAVIGQLMYNDAAAPRAVIGQLLQ